jgi:phospholipid-binding lipoprotein MlaA
VTRRTRRGHRLAAIGAALVAALLFTGCATIQQARGGPGQKLDPWENWNRKVFAFNERLDEYVLKPVATAYANVVPQPVRRGVDNFFANVADAWSAVNNVLQGKGQPAFEDVVRFTTNSFFGIGGVFDVASEIGIPRHKEDFGQTLGVWGFGAGAYIVWPVLGPSSVRDSFGLPLDLYYASPSHWINDGRTQVGLTALQIVNTRANLLGASQVLDDIALDKYTFLRDAYLQRRRSLIFDGDDRAPPDSQRQQDDGEPSAPPGAASAPKDGAPSGAPAASSPTPAASAAR